MIEEKVFKLVTSALNELNAELDYDSLRNITRETAIFGGESTLDSLSLITLIVGLEREIEQAFKKKLLLADEKAMSERNSPFRNVTSLVNFVVKKLRDSDA